MAEKIKNILKKKKGLLLISVGVLLGLLLIMTDSKSAEKNKAADSDESDARKYMTEYVEATEHKLKTMIEKVSGVGNVNVMLTLKSGREYVYASDITENSEDYVLADGSPIYIKEYLPEIEGVAIVCDGGNNIETKAVITELVCSLLGLYSTHVYVTGSG